MSHEKQSSLNFKLANFEQEQNAPIECLGLTFSNDEERRNYFLNKLRVGLEELHAKLGGVPFTTVEDAVERMKSVEKWPMGDDTRLYELAERIREAHRKESEKDLLQLWKDEVGFPHGEIEDILNLSDPPYYTACPNPFIADFIKHYGKPYDPNVPYSKEPFAAELSASRNNPFVNAHSYATKVPHQIVTQLLLHYTDPGDIVLDSYCGSGMTAVAAQFTGRSAIIGDLSPGATFLAANFNLPYSDSDFNDDIERITAALTSECGWLYETTHSDGSKGTIDLTLWSDVFLCPECAGELVFWECAIDEQGGRILDKFPCPHCYSQLTKRTIIPLWETQFDSALSRTVKHVKQVPVLMRYKLGARVFHKKPDENDMNLIQEIEKADIPYWFPTEPLPNGYNTAQPMKSHGTTHIHHFFTRRNLIALACAWAHARTMRARFMLTSLMYKSSILCAPLMSNYLAFLKGKPRGGWAGKERSGTLYCPSIHSEISLLSQIKTRQKAVCITAAGTMLPAISTASATNLSLPSNSVDYIFTDPPFGGNKMYSELNFLWESWLRVWTNNHKESIQNSAQGKDISDYERLMREGFREYYRVLKPGRWITVEFSNTSAAVWNALQNALSAAGFVVADVRSLDKKQGSILGLTTSVASKQDLAISAYKPNGGLEERFKLTAGSEESVWDFVRMHLKQLPVFVSKDGKAEVIAERQNYMLFDRMVAFHVQRGVTVPLSAAEFYDGLAQQLQLFITDEASAIQWLKQQLTRKPQTFQELHPQFLKEIGGWQKHEKPLELSELLEQNFLRYDGKGEVPSQIHSYLSRNFKELRNLPKDDELLRAKAKDRWYVPDPTKATDLERLRERALLREFEEYRESKQKRLKVFRLEAVRAGFKKAWQERDYATIIAVARKIPENVLQEDQKLLMWYDHALTRRGGDINDY